MWRLRWRNLGSDPKRNVIEKWVHQPILKSPSKPHSGLAALEIVLLQYSLVKRRNQPKPKSPVTGSLALSASCGKQLLTTRTFWGISLILNINFSLAFSGLEHKFSSHKSLCIQPYFTQLQSTIWILFFWTNNSSSSVLTGKQSGIWRGRKILGNSSGSCYLTWLNTVLFVLTDEFSVVFIHINIQSGSHSQNVHHRPASEREMGKGVHDPSICDKASWHIKTKVWQKNFIWGLNYNND